MTSVVSSAVDGQNLSLIGTQRRGLPFLIAAAVYAATSAAILFASYHMASGHFIYPLDDTYIGMAIAKHFALHGVWGISPYEFTSATSTPFFVALLSIIYQLTGPNQFAPLALSWMFGLCSIYVAWQIAAEYLGAALQTVALVAAVLFAPLFVIGTLGMEHSLHLLLTLLFLKNFDSDDRSIWPLATITFAMTATRYEGLFVAAAGSLILLAQQKWARALTASFFAWLPPILYALYSVSHHGYWLPNSVALKGAQTHSLGIILSVVVNLITHCFIAPHLFFLTAALVATAVSVRKSHPGIAKMAGVVGGAACLHLAFADTGWVFRYEDYLIASGVVVIACAMPALRPTPLFYCVLAIAGLLTGRALQAALSLPKYSRAIYMQQWQMASFLSTYYPGAAVAANDIGAIDYETDLHLLDLVGLANSDIFNAKHTGTYSTQVIDEQAKKREIELAVIYDSWFSLHPISILGGPPVPSSWIRVRSWEIPSKEQLGDDTVSFYALTPEAAARLAMRLDAFAPMLPKDVTVY